MAYRPPLAASDDRSLTSEFISIQTRLALAPMPAHHGWGHLAMAVASRTDIPINDVPLLTVGVGHAHVGWLLARGSNTSHSPRTPRHDRGPSPALQAAAPFASTPGVACHHPVREIGFKTLALLFGRGLVALPEENKARAGCLKPAADTGQATERSHAVRLPRPTSGARKRTRH